MSASSVRIDQEETPCPLCGSTSARPWLTRTDLLHGCPGEYRVVRCADCGHVYTNPRPTRDSIAACYPESYAPYHQPDHAAAPSGGLKSRLRSLAGLRRLVQRFLESQAVWIPPRGEQATALEIGCGHGAFLEQLQQAGWNAEGLEPSAEAAARARSRGLNVREGMLEGTPLPAVHYDAVFLWMVLEHLIDPVAALGLIRQSLKPGGYLVFSVPNIACWEPYVLRRYWYAWELPRHLQHYSPRSIRRLLAQSGYSVERIIHQRNQLNLVGSLGLWLRDRFPSKDWGARLLNFMDNPTAPGLLLLAPLAKLCAWTRQSGRLTVVARPR